MQGRSVHKLPSSESITVLVSVVNKKLDDIIANTNIVLDFSGCRTELDEMNKRIEVIQKIVDVKQEVGQLTNSLKDLKMFTDEDSNKSKEVTTLYTDLVLKDVRSMNR